MAKTFDNRDVSYNKGKSFNLSQKQLKKAGAAKAAAKRTVSISNTKRATTGPNKGKTLGPAGKPLTGSVKLPSGVTAVYKDGKRVTVSRAKPAAAAGRSASSGSGRSGSTGSGTVTKRVVPGKTVDKGKTGDKGAKPTVRLGKSYTTTTQTNPQASPASATSRANRAARASGQVPSASRSYSNGAASAPPDKRTPAEKTYDTVSKGVKDFGAKATGPWISEADKAKERAKRKMVNDAIKRATKGR